MTIQITCPSCKSTLSFHCNQYFCEQCSATYDVKEGVICLLPTIDEFYEGAYTATMNLKFSNDIRSLKAFFFFSIYRDPYFRAIRKYSKINTKILDVGCGGGVKYLSQKGEVTGLDISRKSLEQVVDFYHTAVQSSALEMPFLDNTFDLVVSSYNLEHFYPKDKSKVLSEIFRVLVPGGSAILLFDCDNINYLFKYFKSDDLLYRQNIIDKDKHYGLELASHNVLRFINCGFSLKEITGLNKTVLQYLAVYGWLQPYSSKSSIVRLVCKISAFISTKKYLWMAYNAILNWVDWGVGFLFPLNNSRVLLIVAKKPGGKSDA